MIQLLSLTQSSEDISMKHDFITPYMKQLVDIWPFVWIWFELLYIKHFQIRKTLQSFSKEQIHQERLNYTVLVQAVCFFSSFPFHTAKEKSPNGLTISVDNVVSLLKMLCSFWMSEAADSKARMGFATSCINASSFALRPIFQEILVADCGGHASKVVDKAILRVRYGLVQPRSQLAEITYHQMAQDLDFITAIIVDPRSCLHNTYYEGNGWEASFVSILDRLLAPPHSPVQAAQLDAIRSAMEALHRHIFQNQQPYNSIYKLMETGFVKVIARHSLLGPLSEDSNQENSSRIQMLCTRIIQLIKVFSMSRHVICGLRRNLVYLNVPCYPHRTQEESSISISLLNLQNDITSFLDAYKTYKRHSSPVLCCGNRQVSFYLPIAISHMLIRTLLASATPQVIKPFCIIVPVANL